MRRAGCAHQRKFVSLLSWSFQVCVRRTPTRRDVSTNWQHGDGWWLACFEATGPVKLVVIEWTMNFAVYQNILKCEAICPTAKAWSKLGHQHDKDPKHRSKSPAECLRKTIIELLKESRAQADAAVGPSEKERKSELMMSYRKQLLQLLLLKVVKATLSECTWNSNLQQLLASQFGITHFYSVTSNHQPASVASVNWLDNKAEDFTVKRALKTLFQ